MLDSNPNPNSNLEMNHQQDSLDTKPNPTMEMNLKTQESDMKCKIVGSSFVNLTQQKCSSSVLLVVKGCFMVGCECSLRL